MAANRRAKMTIESVQVYRTASAGVTQETIKMRAVARKGGYPSDGADEDNTYGRYSPSASREITIANPALFGKLNQIRG
jgi:hypothetical protein